MKETELRIVKAVEHSTSKISEIAKAWGVSDRTVLRIAKKYGVARKERNAQAS